MEKIKVFLSDPQVLFREGIHFILSGEEDFEVTGETTGNDEAYSIIETNPPNIIIISMHGKSGDPEITRRIKRSLPSVSVILTGDNIDDDTLFAAMKSGAAAFLTKDIDPDALLSAIRVVAQGNRPILEALLMPALAAKALTEFEDLATLNKQLDNMLAGLAPRETEVLSNIATGSKIAQVAAKLNTGEDTIRRHLTAILNKLVANDQAKILIEAAQRSLPSIMRGVRTGEPSGNYVTKTEFNEFKDSLMEHFKAFIGKIDCFYAIMLRMVPYVKYVKEEKIGRII